MATETITNTENFDAAEKILEAPESTDPPSLAALDALLDENLKLLDKKLEQFRRDFNTRFSGYSPEFFSDILFVKNLKIKANN
ncbi:MAG TPA: hypothetical protein GXZ36_00830 [Firmicutes bacterium]|nr:hypothetical protein [Bacillota bacterium]